MSDLVYKTTAYSYRADRLTTLSEPQIKYQDLSDPSSVSQEQMLSNMLLGEHRVIATLAAPRIVVHLRQGVIELQEPLSREEMEREITIILKTLSR